VHFSWCAFTPTNHHIKFFSLSYVLGKIWTYQHSLTLGTMVLVALLMINPVSATTADKNVKVIQRLNYGIMFKQEASLFISTESWLHTFQVDLPKNVNLDKMNFCNNLTTNCHTMNSMINFIHSLHVSTETQLVETIKAIRTLIPQTGILTKTRDARSLLPFIGSLAKGLFGTATMGDVELLARHINELNKRSRIMAYALQQHGSHLSSFISLIDNKTTNLIHGVQQNAAEIKKLTTSFYSTLSTFQDSFTNMSKMLISMVNDANILRENLNQFYSSIQSLVEGRISPFLIPKHALLHSLHKVQRILSKFYPGFYLTHLEPNYYYTHSNFIFTRNHSTLFISVRFPLSTHSKPLTLYKIISLPVPVNATSSHATKLMSLPKYVATTYQHDYYVTLSVEDLANCIHDVHMYCPSNIPLIPTSKPSCTMALFNNNVTMVNQLCNFRFLQNHITSTIIELSSTSVLIYNNENDMTLKCPDHSKIIPACPYCIVHVPCMCSLTSPALYLAPRLINCHTETSVLTAHSNSYVLHPVNLALLTQFFNATKLKAILGDTTFPSQVSLKIPNFKIYSHNMSKILVADQQQHLSLQKMAQAAKNDEQIFKTLTEPLLTGDISLEPEWPDLNGILNIIALSVGFLSFIICVYLFFKIRKMTTALLVLTEVSRAKSQTVPSFIYEQLTTESKESVDSELLKLFTPEFSWVHASVLLSIIVLIILIIIMVYICKHSKSKGTTLAIEITCGGECVVVPITSLSLCPSYWDIDTPNINNISISSFPSCKLFTTWSKFKVTNKLTAQSLAVPTVISLSYYMWFKLRKILRQPYCAYVMVIHNGYASLLPGQQLEQVQNSLYPKL